MAKKKTLSAEEKAKIEAQNNIVRIEKYTATVNAIYDDFAEELGKLASTIKNIDLKKVFSFADYPATKSKVEALINKTNLSVVNTIGEGKEDAILRANIKNDALIDAVAKSTSIPEKQLAKYYERNLTAALTRRTKSQLSQKVYKITKQFTRVAELGIDVGIAKGVPARALASEIKKAVKTPEFTFRRVRNEKGNLEWSKAAKKYAKENPDAAGVGKYLNPQKNFERLTRTEINMSYRTADFERQQDLDFVVGIKINLSTNPNHCPLCIQLAGLYPKTFLFRGWHPQCRCYSTTVLKTPEEISADSIRIFQGKEPLKLSVNTVKKPHEGFRSLIKEKGADFEAARKRNTMPYWVHDNFKAGESINIKNLVPGRVVGGVQQ